MQVQTEPLPFHRRERLRAARGYPIRVMSLLSSPTGHLSNLSDVPARSTVPTPAAPAPSE